MKVPNYLLPWAANSKQGLPILFLVILLSGVIQFAAFAMSQNFVISSLGAQPEDITLALQLTYVGILVMLPLHFRAVRFFELKNYLIAAMIVGILLNIACLNTNDLILFFIIRLLQGLIVCAVCGTILLLLSIYLKMEHKQILGPSIFYGTVLSSGILIGMVFANVSLNSDWKEIYQYLIAFQVFALSIVVFAFSPNSGVKPYPLYQIDWIGSVFFITAAVSLAYTLIYGSKYYWFSDYRIQISSCLAFFTTLLFLFRMGTVKRPLISLKVFQYPKFWAGLILLALYYGIKESLNLVFGYTAGILQWSSTQTTGLGLYNIAGLVIFMVISGKLILSKKVPLPILLVAGFAVLLGYHIWVYQLLTPDLSYQDLVVPMFLQGAASGLLFVPIMIFILSSVPQTTGMTGVIVAAYVRFVTLLNVSAGLYNLQLYYNQLFKESFLIHLSNVDHSTSQRLLAYKQLFLTKGFSAGQAESLANLNLSKAIAFQTQLLSTRAIFLLFCYLIIIILVVLTIFVCSMMLKKKE